MQSCLKQNLDVISSLRAIDICGNNHSSLHPDGRIEDQATCSYLLVSKYESNVILLFLFNTFSLYLLHFPGFMEYSKCR